MHPSIQPYAAFSVKDGSKVIIAIQNEREWARFCSQVLKNLNLLLILFLTVITQGLKT